MELKKQLEEISGQNENLKAENAKLLRELDEEKSKVHVESFDVPQSMATHFDDPTRTVRIPHFMAAFVDHKPYAVRPIIATTSKEYRLNILLLKAVRSRAVAIFASPAARSAEGSILPARNEVPAASVHDEHYIPGSISRHPVRIRHTFIRGRS